MNSNNKVKLPQLSIEFISAFVSVMIFITEDKEAFMKLMLAFFTNPGDEENFSFVETAIKKNLDQSVNLVCLMGLLEKLLKSENTPRAKVSLIYFAHREVIHPHDPEINRQQAQALWSRVWMFAGQVPSVAAEIQEREKNRDLLDWKADVQNFTRRRWRTLKSEQFPRLKAEIQGLQKKVNEFLKIVPAKVDEKD